MGDVEKMSMEDRWIILPEIPRDKLILGSIDPKTGKFLAHIVYTLREDETK